MNPLIKWPGGKSGEIEKIERLIPQYNRYLEPFFGGGALFFYLQLSLVSINDISSSLVEFYKLIKEQDKTLHELLLGYCNSFSELLMLFESNYSDIFDMYEKLARGQADAKLLMTQLFKLINSLEDKISSCFTEELLLNVKLFKDSLVKMAYDKIRRTVNNNKVKPFSDGDLKANLITGFASGYYMYFRDVYNLINTGKISHVSPQYRTANFYFIREYCYGSMFRYNSKGEFNIPYGGITYNKKNFKQKINNIFCNETELIFQNTDIQCFDFEEFLERSNLKENDFVFLDPPYDTDFSDYEGRNFTKQDHVRLANVLKRIPAKFILIIKNTDFIHDLYYGNDFEILSFDNRYTYNVRSRNERGAEHLIITNLPTC